MLVAGQFKDALQLLLDWLYKVEPSLNEDQPVHGDIDTVNSLTEHHKVACYLCCCHCLVQLCIIPFTATLAIASVEVTTSSRDKNVYKSVLERHSYQQICQRKSRKTVRHNGPDKAEEVETIRTRTQN